MGTNYYWSGDQYQYPDGSVRTYAGARVFPGTAPWLHIGKRSAAGPYCWDCMVTLNEGGIDCIHQGEGNWLDRCPRCHGAAGPSRGPEHFSERTRAVDMELGWQADRKLRPAGVGSASSFTWALDPMHVAQACLAFPQTGIIQSEYKEIYTGTRFLKMLEYNCPIHFYDAIGRNFT